MRLSLQTTVLAAIAMASFGSAAFTAAQPSRQPDAATREVRRPQVEVTDTWTEPFLGVRYLVRETTLPCVIHAAVVDLTAPGVRVIATPYESRWQTVTEFAERNHAAVATNGGFWGMLQRARGLAAGGGRRWGDGEDDEEVGFFAVARNGRAWISPPEEVVQQIGRERLSEAVSGEPMLVRGGRIDSTALDAFESANLRHPRTAIGTSRDGKRVFLVVSDGRQGHSRGMTLYELARLFVDLGAFAAINLDGGGSSAMFVASEGGIVNVPSGGRWEVKLGLGATREQRHKHLHGSKVRLGDGGVEEVFIRGREREVMNHVAVIATPIEHALRDAGAQESQPAQETTIVPPKPPAMRLGRSREWIAPLIAALFIFVPVTVGAYLLRRRWLQRPADRAANPPKD